MKKTLALMLMLCMMTTAFFGSALAADKSQDDQPPKLLAKTTESAQVLDDHAIVLTDVHHRADAANTVAANRLSTAFLNVMDTVHHSDVECLLHSHDVKVDINTVLKSLAQDLDAHDLVMYELFDVTLSDDVAAQLTEGGYVELTFEVAQKAGAPLITLFTPDGTLWQVLPTVNNGNTFTVKLPASGTLALLCDGKAQLGIGDEVKRVEIAQPDEERAESGADNFMPSASGKPAPQVVTFTIDGETYVGYIRNNIDATEIPVPDRNYVVITSVMERKYSVDIQTYEHLNWAYESILQVENVGDLYTEHDMSVTLEPSEHQKLAGALDAVLAQLNTDLTSDQLVVSELFEVTAYGDYLHHLYDENYYLELTFATNLDPEEPLVVIHSADSKHWHVHDSENVIVNADGTVTLKLYDLGAVAFLVEGEFSADTDSAIVMAP